MKALITVLLCGVWIWILRGTDFEAGYFYTFMFGKFAFTGHIYSVAFDVGAITGILMTVVVVVITVAIFALILLYKG